VLPSGFDIHGAFIIQTENEMFVWSGEKAPDGDIERGELLLLML
jgi:hypothetical protein